jgi:hypothetical protein
MTGLILNRWPTCLACIRRIGQPFGSINANAGAGAGAVSIVQTRAKSKTTRPQDQGVIVRLLEDIPKFGRKGVGCLRGSAPAFALCTLHSGLWALKSMYRNTADTNRLPRLLDAVFRIERGRMRNEWYPNNKAEYMTTTRFQQLGLTRSDIGDRDRAFGSSLPTPGSEATPEPEPVAPASRLHYVSVSCPLCFGRLLCALCVHQGWLD